MLTIEAVHVLGEGASVGLEKVVFESEGEESVDFGEEVVEGYKIAWRAVVIDDEEVVEGWWD